jgi:hypothetical protein
MIVNFAVEDNAVVAVLAKEWLVARLQVENLQARCAEGELGRSIDTVLIRATMYERRRGGGYALERRQPTSMGESDDSAQVGDSPVDCWTIRYC